MDRVQFSDIEELIKAAFDEDIRSGDVTSAPIFPKSERTKASIRAKESGVFCGGFLGEYIYSQLDSSIVVTQCVKEGARVNVGDIVMEFEGATVDILAGERILLNFLQRMCGIATKTAAIVDLVAGTNIKILDTRKTLPGFRLLDKYAVKAGGGTNHRMGLFDMVMIKDNHIKAAGSIAQAVAAIRSASGDSYRIEVETTNLAEVKEAVLAKADVIMLDNMNKEQMAEALVVIDKNAQVEISGNMSAEKIADVKDLDVDFVSIGALTHSVEAFDLSMKF